MPEDLKNDKVSSEEEAKGDPSEEQKPSQKPSGDEEEFDKDRALQTIREQRRSEANLQKQLKDAQAKLKEFEDKDLSESQKLQRDLEEATKLLEASKSELRSLKAENALSRAGALHPELVATQLPESALESQRELQSAVADLKKRYPQLFRADGGGSGDGPVEAQKTKSSDMNRIIRSAIGRP